MDKKIVKNGEKITWGKTQWTLKNDGKQNEQ